MGTPLRLAASVTIDIAVAVLFELCVCAVCLTVSLSFQVPFAVLFTFSSAFEPVTPCVNGDLATVLRNCTATYMH